MAGSFEGRVVVVSGGTGALGCAVTGFLLDAGADVHIPVLESETPHHFGYAGHERVHLRHGVDLGDEDQVVDFYQRVTEGVAGTGSKTLWASIHLAGGFSMKPLVDTSLAELERMWRM